MMLAFIAEAAVRSGALIAAVWVLLKVCRLRHPSGEKLAWTLVVAASLAMPLLSWSIVDGEMPLKILPMQLAVSMGARADLSPETQRVSEVLLTVYFLGLATFVLRLGFGLVIGARLCQRAQRAPARDDELDVRVSTEVQGPVSYGSTVILPARSVGWDARTLRAVLAHEHEHIRNHDSYRLWLASLCRAVFWFNPLAHWLYRRLTILTELTSDAAAVIVIGDRSTYVNVLLQVATGTPALQATVPMAIGSTLPGRIRLLLAPQDLPAPASLGRKSLLGCVVLLLSVVTAACAAKPVVLTGTAVTSVLRVDEAPTLTVLKEFYPPILRRQRIQGLVMVRITVDASGRVVHTSIVKETPAGVGLGAAAQGVAREFHFDNSLHRAVITTLPVRFALPQEPAGSPPAAPAPG